MEVLALPPRHRLLRTTRPKEGLGWLTRSRALQSPGLVVVLEEVAVVRRQAVRAVAVMAGRTRLEPEAPEAQTRAVAVVVLDITHRGAVDRAL